MDYQHLDQKLQQDLPIQIHQQKEYAVVCVVVVFVVVFAMMV